jgi:hypothetical protein
MELIGTYTPSNKESTLSANEGEVKSIRKIPRRHKLILGFRHDDEPITTRHQQEEEMPKLRPTQLSSRPDLLKQLSASSHPVIGLGDLASMLMPPKIVRNKNDDHSESPQEYCIQRVHRRSSSCTF